MKVLVTGASGLIGAHVTQALLDQDAEPVACDTVPFVPPMGADSNRVPFVLADVSDLDALSSILETYQIDRIVHSAAILARTCQENPTPAVNVNVAFAIFGGTAPLVATQLISMTGDPLSPSYWLIFAAVVSLLVILSMKERYREALR